MVAKIGPARMILAAKWSKGPILAKFSAKIGPARQIVSCTRAKITLNNGISAWVKKYLKIFWLKWVEYEGLRPL